MAAINNNNENNKAMEILNEMYDLIAVQKADGNIYLKGTSLNLNDSILDSRVFMRAVETFVASVIDGNGYDAMSTLVYICDIRHSKQLDIFVKVISNMTDIPSDDELAKWTFDDALLNFVWKSSTFDRKVAVILYGMVSALSDTGFDLKINNYNGDIAPLSSISQNFAPLFRWDYDVPNKECECVVCTDVTEHTSHSNKRKAK